MKSVKTVVQEVFSQPTAPFREQWVLNHITHQLRLLKMPFFIDQWGNIVAGARSPKAIKTSERLVLMAHTDHPGFHLEKRMAKNVWKARWLGGCPPKIKRAKLRIHIPQFPESRIRARCLTTSLSKDRKLKLQILDGDDSRLTSQCFGAFDFPGFSLKKTRVSTRAADDLAGVAIILATIARLKAPQKKHFLGIFTRAEETGFKGALGVLHDRLLSSKHLVISLEASRQLPNARIGCGPVIRLGDKRSLFSTEVVALMDLADQELKKRQKGFKTQRRIMPGGTCEATVFNLNGIPSAGLCVPLGNYHNERANGLPGREFIDLTDVESAIALCVQTYKCLKKKPIPKLLRTLNQEFRKVRGQLRQPLSFKERV